MHQLRVNVFCPSLTFSTDNCTVLFWPCGLQISLEPQMPAHEEYCPVLLRYERPSLPRFECWRPLIHISLCFLPLFGSSKQWKNSTSVKMPWSSGSSLWWKWLSWSSLSSVQSAVPWYTKEGGDTQKCLVGALWEQDLPDSLQSVLDNYQHFRGGEMWNDCALPSVWLGIFNGIEITQFRSCWSFPTMLQLLMVFLKLFSPTKAHLV